MENTLIINKNLRTITIPESIKNLGVESDDGVLRLHFSMPKTYGDIDLSAFNIRINYTNAAGEGDVYPVVDNTVNGDTITFSWLVSRFATKSKGSVKFNVCLRELDEAGDVAREFNTTPAVLPVLEGLETTSAVVQQNPDALEEIQRDLAGTVKTVNGTAPDENGNVQVETGGSISEYTQPEWGAKGSVTSTEVALELSYDGDMLSAPVEAEVADMILAGLADVECKYSDGTTFTVSDIDYDGVYLKVPNPGDPDTVAYINGTINNTVEEIAKIPAKYLETDDYNAKINSFAKQLPLYVTFNASGETGEVTCDTEVDVIVAAFGNHIPIIALLVETDSSGYPSYDQTALVCRDYLDALSFRFPCTGRHVSYSNTSSTIDISDLT